MKTSTDLFARPFEELEAGDAFATRGRTITEADLVGFSSLTGDWHPQHADATWAARGPFGERIAHGMLVLSYALGLAGIDPERVMALRGIKRATFKAPVRIGDTIRVRGRISGLTSVDDRTGLVECAWDVVNQHDRVVARLVLEVIWRAGDGTPPAAFDNEPELVVPPL